MPSNFQNTSITFAEVGLQGESVLNPTAIDFSKTGNPVLFVTQQNGLIKRYEIERQDGGAGADTFVVTGATTISTIVNGTQNYNDDGALNTTKLRQVTGLVTTTDADGNDVLYVSSSDWRIAVSEDSGLDTNSGQIHRIVLDPETGAVLSNVAVVRGLPRSEENHSNNGLDIRVDPVTGHEILWIAQGGNTNMVAPSDKFAGTPEFALAAAILKLDLTALEAYDVRTDGAGEKFILDLPTLDDPSRPNVDLAALGVQNLEAAPTFTLDNNGTGANGQLRPDWAGGADGLNMAKIVDHALVSQGGQLAIVPNPLSVHSPGFRNPYDVLVTEKGDVYTWDNGPNAGWGGQAIPFEDNTPGGAAWVENWQTELATNQFSEQGSAGFGDTLHYLGHVTDLYGPYAGHAHPIRAGAEVLAAAFNADGSYAGATPNSAIVVNGVELFANEAEARSYLQSLLIIYAEQGDGNWVDIGAALPADFFDVVSGYHWAHPGSSIGDPKKHFDGTSVMDGTAFSPESQVLFPNQDGSLFTVNASTNGLAEYTASFFAGELEGAIMGASFDGSIYFVKPADTNGDGRPDAAQILGTIGGFGSTPLGLVALGDDGLSPTLIDNDGDGVDDFAGVIVAATYGADDITFFIPGGTPVDPNIDLDMDGVDNTLDTHVGDPLDGKGVSAGPGQAERWEFELSNPAGTPQGAVPPGDSVAGDIGINAVWHNGTDPQVALPGAPALYDPAVWNLGGASSFVSLDQADDGSAEGAANDQADVVGIGFVAPSDTGLVTITSEMVNIFAYSLNTNPGEGDPKSWAGGEKVGLVAGPGNQSDFVQAAVAAVDQGGTVEYGIELVVETGDVPERVFVEIPGIEAPVNDGVGDPDMQVALDIDLNPGVMAVTARARYVNAGAYTDWVETPPLAVPAPVAAALRGQFQNEGKLTGGFVGLLATAAAGDDSFGASWDWVEVAGTPRDPVSGEVVLRWNAGTSNVAAIDGGPAWVADAGAIVGSAKIASSAIAASGTLDGSVPGTTPKGIFAQEYYGSSKASPFGLEFGDGTLAVGAYAVRLYMGNGYAGTNDPGERIFDVSVENQLFLDDLDLSGTLGHLVGGMFEWQGQVTDGTIDIDFAHVFENPLINAVEIVRLDGGTPPPAPEVSVLDATVGESAGSVTVTIETDKIVPVNQTVTVNFQIVGGSATPALDYQAAGLAFANGVYSGSVQIAGGSADATVTIDILPDSLVEGSESLAVNIVSVAGAGATVADGSATVTIVDDDTAPPSSEVVHRWNAGSSTVAATDGGLAWVADPSVIVGAAKLFSSPIAASGTLAATVPGTTPKGIFAQEYYGSSSASPFGLEFGEGTLAAGSYAVRLYMGNGWSGTNDPGERIFDVLVENQLIPDGADPDLLPDGDNVDLSARFGHLVGGMLEWQGQVTDGTIDIDFLHGVQNPLINGVEIIRIGGTTPPTNAAPVISTPATLSAPENQTAVVTVAATDADSDPITYSITGGGDAAKFAINAQTGALSFVTAPNFEAPGDADGNGIYLVEVGASDGTVTTKKSLAVGVTDVGEGTSGRFVFRLVDADTDTVLDADLSDGVSGLTAADLAGTLAVAAFAAGTGSISGPVALTLSGPSGTFTRTESAAPYAIFGDTNGNFAGKVLQAGQHSFSATNAGQTETVAFTLQAGGTPPAPKVSVLDAIVGESGGNVALAFKTDTAVPSGQVVTVNFQILGGTATPAQDYQAAGLAFANGIYSGTVQIAGGATTATLPVSILGDAAVEGNETFTVNITSVSGAGATLADGTATVTILDDDAASDSEVVYRWNAGTSTVAATDGGLAWVADAGAIIGAAKATASAIAASGTLDGSVPGTTPKAIFAQEYYGSSKASPLGLEFGGGTLAAGSYAVRLYMGNGYAGTNDPGERLFDVSVENQLFLDDLDLSGTLGHLVGGMFEWQGEVTDGTIDIDFAHVFENPLINAVEIVRLDGGTPPQSAGAATLVVTPNGNIQTSTFDSNSFTLTNTGDKAITRVVIDIADALYPDMVFDPFGLAGDTTFKGLTINTNGGTGVVAPSSSSYIGAGGTAGYEAIQLVFNPASNGGFQAGEAIGFSVDNDPNSVAGAAKAPLDAGTSPSWDVGGVSGAELIGSTFTVEFSDGTSATGKLQGMGNQSGAHGIASQASPELDVTLTANGIAEGAAGAYGDGGPTILIQGPAGATARVVLTKGFIQPVTNTFPDTADPNEYHDRLDAQLAALAASDFPANNAVEFQTVNVPLTGAQQDISGMFDFADVAAFNLTSFVESELPLGFVASVIDPQTGLPLGEVTDPIHLVYDELL